MQILVQNIDQRRHLGMHDGKRSKLGTNDRMLAEADDGPLWAKSVIATTDFESPHSSQRVDNLLVRIHCIIVKIRWTGLAPWEFVIPFPGSFTSTIIFLAL